jgi:hypothetical protein
MIPILEEVYTFYCLGGFEESYKLFFNREEVGRALDVQELNSEGYVHRYIDSVTGEECCEKLTFKGSLTYKINRWRTALPRTLIHHLESYQNGEGDSEYKFIQKRLTQIASFIRKDQTIDAYPCNRQFISEVILKLKHFKSERKGNAIFFTTHLAKDNLELLAKAFAGIQLFPNADKNKFKKLIAEGKSRQPITWLPKTGTNSNKRLFEHFCRQLLRTGVIKTANEHEDVISYLMRFFVNTSQAEIKRRPGTIHEKGSKNKKYQHIDAIINNFL